MVDINAGSELTADWEKLRPVIDDAIGQLDDRDRSAILLRFFRDCSYPQVAAKLGLTESGARLRVDRALDKLSAVLSSRGITSTSVALGVALAGQSAAAAPVGLAASILVATSAAGIATAPVLFMTASFLKISLATAVLATAGVTLVLQQRAVSRQEQELIQLQSGNRGLDELRAENSRLKNEVAAFNDLRRDEADLARIRSKLGLGSVGDGRGRPTRPLPRGFVGAGEFRNRGIATPEAALETLYWAKSHLDIDALEKVVDFSPELRAKAEENFASCRPRPVPRCRRTTTIRSARFC